MVEGFGGLSALGSDLSGAGGMESVGGFLLVMMIVVEEGMSAGVPGAIEYISV